MHNLCLLFDSDGTLVDSEYWCNLAIVESFETLGVNLGVNHLIQTYRGGKMSEIMQTLALQHQVTLPEGFIENYRQRVNVLFTQHLKPIANIPEVLAQLPYPKAVVSNGPKAKIVQAISLCNIAHFFGNNIFSAYEVKCFKPDPEIYCIAARAMGYTPQQCIVIEDSLTGATASSRAGMNTLFFNRFDEKINLPRVISFNNMKDLPVLIRSLSK